MNVELCKSLTDREHDVAVHLAEGVRMKVIGEMMGLKRPYNQIVAYVTRLRLKTGQPSTEALIAFLRDEGYANEGLRYHDEDEA